MEIIGASILVSVITTKILATYYFKKVDGYVKDIKSFWKLDVRHAKTWFSNLRGCAPGGSAL